LASRSAGRNPHPAADYFGGLIAWYETADIGVTGEPVFAAVTEALARDGLRSALNPGHLAGHDEWIHTPIRPGSGERIASGMPFQVDIIPTPMRDGWALDCEDGIVFADPAASIDALMPSALLACARTIADACMTAVDNKQGADGSGLTRRLIRFREIRVNSVH
jgi:hypothetical protein